MALQIAMEHCEQLALMHTDEANNHTELMYHYRSDYKLSIRSVRHQCALSDYKQRLHAGIVEVLHYYYKDDLLHSTWLQLVKIGKKLCYI